MRFWLGQNRFVGREKSLAIMYVVINDANVNVRVPFLEATSFQNLIDQAFHLLPTLNPKSSPGPMYAHHATYKSLLDDHVIRDGLLDRDRVCIEAAFLIVNRVRASLYNPEMVGLEALLAGCNPLTRPFVKNEPNPLRKYEKGIARVVISMSADALLADKMTVDYDEPEIGTSSMVFGWGLTPDKVMAMHNGLLERWKPGYNLAVDDVAGWETSVTRRTLLWTSFAASISTGVPWAVFPMLRFHASMLANVLYVLSDGTVVEKSRPSMMPSGNWLTTFYNGLSRQQFGVAIGSRGMNHGDDQVEITNLSRDEIISRYAAMGLTVRSVEMCNPYDFEFCSHRIQVVDGLPRWWHTNLEKSLFKALANGKSLQDAALCLVNEFSSCREAVDFITLVEQLSAYLQFRGCGPETYSFDSESYRTAWEQGELIFETRE